VQMMRVRSGRIINLTSVSGLIGIAGQTNYSAAKAAIIGFTRSLAKEMAAWGVPVNAVAPGFTETDMLASQTQEQRAAALARVPMRRFASAEEVARVVRFLALDAPTYLTGHTLVIDGGLTG
jgi:3-oxoacyl-[acyl-carrier protein] reductase